MLELAPLFLRNTPAGLLSDPAEQGGVRRWLVTGAYWFEFEDSRYNGILKLVPVGTVGGSHDVLWRHFLKYLSDYGTYLLNNHVPMAPQAVARFVEIRDIVLAPGNRGSWLPFVRNEINYQHEYGTWFPFKGSQSKDLYDVGVLTRSSDLVELRIDVAKKPVKAFDAVACCLACLSNDLAVLLKERAGRGAARFRVEWNQLDSALRR